MPTAKPETDPVEVLPPEKGVIVKDSVNSNSIWNLNEQQDEVILYHLAGERCVELSIWCAAMSGAALAKKKTALRHGKYGDYLKSLPFSDQTAYNYIGLAKKLEQKLNALSPAEIQALLPAIKATQRDLENRMSLLSLPSPMDVFNPAHDQISSLVKHLTNGQTITQLLFDWDIIRKPKLLGGHHPSDHPIPVGLERERLQAEAYWSDKNLAELFHKGVEKKLWKHLSIEKMRMIHDVCGTIHAELGHVLKDKKA